MTTQSTPITTGGKERLALATQTLIPAFRDDPVMNWLLHDLTSSQRALYFPTFLTTIVRAAALNAADILEARDWASCLVLMHPGHKADNPLTWFAAGLPSALWNLGVAGCRRMLFAYPSATDAAKARALGRCKRYFYVFIAGTRSDARNLGLCSALIRQCQQIAEKEGCPKWLEATTAKSHVLYEKLGFETTEMLVLGKGEVGGDGSTKAGGEGVVIWAMVWWPRGGEGEVSEGRGTVREGGLLG